MTGRLFNTPNVTRPACVDAMAQNKPACFSSRATWTQWLDEAWRLSLNTKAARSAMSRGVVPDYCADCHAKFRVQMLAQGRCEPPTGANPPLLEIINAAA